ncbi:cell division control protein Cdc25 [Blastomyces gilchristii SLH14081]|uniref:Class E vacuolar protein-sorting machinery protein HSE1 n=1 Tax=Blastomyces gilchristii (strain SLH14081) TaxID=559298 RepID=A0A179UFB9_BLAGS|nr:cell division control protein Cdc25 [Blastomyces gilchristii SLH14081]OAT06520.1 cell division control protein Cdc25 [Blastomyces gilchristii SLH14081]
MYSSRSAVPLTANSKSVLHAKPGTFAAAFHYTEDETPSQDDSQYHSTNDHSYHEDMARHHGNDGYVTNNNRGAEEGESQPALYVRALYNYTADDHTSLSFRQGDIIQVLNQLDTGWWDGVMGDVRGWFPSNYCAVVTDPDSIGLGGGHYEHEGADTSAESGADDYDDDDDDLDSEGNPKDEPSILPIEGARGSEHEEAAFWIPQATADGRLFYFNTLTGRSTAELPLESPMSATDTGPRDRTNIFVPEQTRPPPELMVGGIDRDEDDYDGSGSEAEGESLIRSSHDSESRRRRSFISDGVSPATSLDSINTEPIGKPYSESKHSRQSPHTSSNQLAPNNGMISSAQAAHFDRLCAQSISSTIPRHFLDDRLSAPLTWNKLVGNMRQAIDAYRRAIMEGHRAQYVKRAEDISDHLRMLLAAGSDTTDNHSGNPSIISTNKALYPHFRDMMSKFSKLPIGEGLISDAKCLQEAEGVLHGVYGYVEVAKQQRGDDINRLVPGFVQGSASGGHWQNNNVGIRNSTSFFDHANRESGLEPAMVLDSNIVDRIESLKDMLTASARRLEEKLSLSEKTITPRIHLAIADAVCAAGSRVVECFQPWISLVESIDLAPLERSSQNPQLVDFSLQKQRAYDGVADLVLSCQAVSAPLADEWAELRGDTLETRLASVRAVSRQLQNYMTQIGFSLTLLLEQAPSEAPPARDIGSGGGPSNVPSGSIGVPSSYPPADRQPVKSRANIDKAQRFFGDTIPTEPAVPWFLNIDHESEVFYDNKGDVPTLKCGTLAGLVEHLTRHDKLDTSFNATFLLTYRSFTTASELFEMLVHRFTLQPPYGLDKADLQTWTEQKQVPIRIRVVNIMKNWFENYWMEPNDDVNIRLLQRVYAFVKDSVGKTKTPGSQQLLSLIEQRMRGQDTSAKRLVPTISGNAPPSILPKNMKKLKFLDIDPMEFARQLTIIESRLYAKIKPTECLNKTWQKKLAPDEPDPAANVKALILHSNQLTNWVAEMILHQQDVKRRVVVIKHFVLIAERCRSMNNYSTLTSIISALGTAPIHRLSRTWAQVSARISAVLENMRRLMASTKNFGEYREALHLANPPCIPFFGVYLTDLTFIEDGIPSLTQSHLINFNKRAKTAEVIRDIQQYQNAPYPFHPVPELQDYVLSNMQAAGDVHEMYERSLEIEPREREDEKIARLLSESGFL